MTGPRQCRRARARRTASSEAPLIALAGGLAAGALIAALLPRTDSEDEARRPDREARKKRQAPRRRRARKTGTKRLSELGISRDKGEETLRSLLRVSAMRPRLG